MNIEVFRQQLLQYPEDSPQVIRSLYEYDDKKMQESIDILEDWLKKQHHFLKIDLPRKYITNNILGSKGSIEKTKSKLDRLFTLRTVLPQFYEVGDFKNIKDLAKCSVILPLPKLTDNYERILLFKFIGNEYFEKIPFLDYYRMFVAYFEYLKMYDCSDGYRVIVDYRDVNIMDIVTKLNPVEVKQLTTLVFEGYGARVKGIHLITPSKAVETLLKFIKPLFKPKVAARFQVHESLESLHKVISQDILPKELGGTVRTFTEIQEDWIQVLKSEESLQFFREMNKAQVNETYRQKEMKNIDMGLPGTFRAMSVD